MTLNAAIAAELPFLRREAEAMMTLTLAAYAPNGTTQDADGYDVPAFTSEGATFGKVQGGTQGKDTPTRYLNIGGVERPILTAGLHIPIAAKVPVASEQRGQAWEYEVTAIGAHDDPALLGVRFMVVGVPMKSKATARRLDVIRL